MVLNHVCLALAWIIYCVLHSVLASTAVKRKAQQWMKSSFKYYRPAYTAFAFAGLAALLWWLIDMNSIDFFETGHFGFFLGFILMLSGFILMMVCIQKYFLSLSGIKSMIKESFSNQLIITGVHKYVRHPLYLGTFAFIWGLWLLFPTLSFLITNVIITVYTLIGIELEEKKLVLEFGDSYKSYQRNVPKLLPRLCQKEILPE